MRSGVWSGFDVWRHGIPSLSYIVSAYTPYLACFAALGCFWADGWRVRLGQRSYNQSVQAKRIGRVFRAFPKADQLSTYRKVKTPGISTAFRQLSRTTVRAGLDVWLASRSSMPLVGSNSHGSSMPACCGGAQTKVQ